MIHGQRSPFLPPLAGHGVVQEPVEQIGMGGLKGERQASHRIGYPQNANWV